MALNDIQLLLAMKKALDSHVLEAFDNENDRTEAVACVLTMTRVLYQPMVVMAAASDDSCGVLSISPNDLPLQSRHFPEHLRLLANILQIIREERPEWNK